MPSVPKFSYTRLFVQELRDEGNGLKRIITSPGNEQLGLLTDGQARYSNGIQWYDRLSKNKGILPDPFEGIVLARDVSRSTTVRHRRRGQLGGNRVLSPDYTTVSTGRIGSEWVWFIDNNLTVFTVLARNVGNATRRYLGPQYVPIPKEVQMVTFRETFGTVEDCYKGQLKRGGRISPDQFKRIVRANDIDANMTKMKKCEALERMGEFAWA